MTKLTGYDCWYRQETEIGPEWQQGTFYQFTSSIFGDMTSLDTYQQVIISKSDGEIVSIDLCDFRFEPPTKTED